MGEEQNFQKELSKNNTILEHVKLNDHHALGVIDAFAKQLKRILSKEFLDNKRTKWINILPTIVEQYNDTPHYHWTVSHQMKLYMRRKSASMCYS